MVGELLKAHRAKLIQDRTQIDLCTIFSEKKIYFLNIWQVLDEIMSETFTILLFKNISDFSDVHLMSL